jgi:histidinol-phosphate aminotransferase
MIIENLMRENIKNLKPYTSARDSFLEGILLDANENGFGSVWDEYEMLNRYPDPNHGELRKVTGELFGIDPKNLFYGVGSDEIIDLLIRIFCIPAKDKVMVTAPSYGMYEVSCDVNDVKVTTIELDDNLQLDIETMLKSVEDKIKIIFICSPNNPTGNLIRTKDIIRLCSETESVIVVDEAYIDFCENNSLIHEVKNYENLVVTRTFSKAWGMAGLRCGFCVANEKIIETLYKVKAPYNLNMLTQHGAIKAVKNNTKRDEFVKNIILEREKLINELEKTDGIIKVYPSDANFIIFQVKEPDHVYEVLVQKGVIIRNRSRMPKIKGCLRVTVGNNEENKIFMEELKRIL